MFLRQIETPEKYFISFWTLIKFTKTKKGEDQAMSKISIQPLGDRVLVEQKQETEQIKGGIVIPDSAKEKPLEAVVVALGTGKLDDKGNKIPFDVKVGDVVLTSKYGGTEVKYDDKEYKILSSSDILAVIRK